MLRWKEIVSLREEVGEDESVTSSKEFIAAEEAYLAVLQRAVGGRGGGEGGKRKKRTRSKSVFVRGLVEEGREGEGGEGGRSEVVEHTVGKMSMRYPSLLMTKRLRRFKPLLKTVFHPEYLAVTALLRTMPQDLQESVPNLVVSVFETRGAMLPLLSRLVEMEVAATTAASTLFRTNSPSTKLMKAYSRVVGADYLHGVIGPLVKNLLAAAESGDVSHLVFPHETDSHNKKKPQMMAPPPMGMMQGRGRGGSGGSGSGGGGGGGGGAGSSSSVVGSGAAGASHSPLMTSNVARGKKYSLHAREGPLKGCTFPLTIGKEVTIGRSTQRNNTIVIPGTGQAKELGDDSVSKVHAQLAYSREDDVFVLSNLSSTNQIFVRTTTVDPEDPRGKKKVVMVNSGESIPVRKGYLIRIGVKSKFAVIVQDLLESEGDGGDSSSSGDGGGEEELPRSLRRQPSKEFLGDKVFTSARYLVDWVLAQVESTPVKFMDLCYEMRRIVAAKFPEAELTPVVGFFFLRFVCPAIVSPYEYGVVPEQVPGPLRVQLVKVAKLLQSLANKIISGAKSQDALAPSAGAAANAEFARLKMREVRTFLLNISKTAPAKGTSSGSLNITERDCRNLLYHFERAAESVLPELDVIASEISDLDASVVDRTRSLLVTALETLPESDAGMVATLECEVGKRISGEDGVAWVRRYLPDVATEAYADSVIVRWKESGLIEEDGRGGWVVSSAVSITQAADVVPFINDVCTLFQLFEADGSVVPKESLSSVAQTHIFREWLKGDAEARRRLSGSFCLGDTNMAFFFYMFSMVKHAIAEVDGGGGLSPSASMSSLGRSPSVPSLR